MRVPPFCALSHTALGIMPGAPALPGTDPVMPLKAALCPAEIAALPGSPPRKASLTARTLLQLTAPVWYPRRIPSLESDGDGH